MPCPTTAEFAEYLCGDPTHRAHIVECLRCGAIAAALRFANGMNDLDAAAAEVERREAAALAAVEELESRLPHVWAAHARSDARLHSPEGVRRLMSRAFATYGVTPRRALALSRAAVTCAVIGTVAPAITFTALKEFSTYSLRVADDLDTAIGALDTAEAFVPLTEEPVLWAAILAHARAYVYGHSTCAQWGRALSLLDECEAVFERRDPARWRRARHLRAAVLLRQCDFDGAVSLYRDLIESEAEVVAAAHLENDLAECYSRMGRATEALPLVTNALAVLSKLGDPEMITRAMWTRGVALSGVGDHDEAERTLEGVRQFFATAGLNDDELGAQLSLIQAMLARDPSAPVASRLEEAYLLACALDSAQPLRTAARRAEVWASLRAAHEGGALTAPVLAHASEYLRTVGRGDEAPFVPLQ